MNDSSTITTLSLVALAALLLGARIAIVATSKARIQTAVLILLLPAVSCLLCILIFALSNRISSGILGFILFWGMVSFPIAIVASAFGWAATWIVRYVFKLFRDRR